MSFDNWSSVIDHFKSHGEMHFLPAATFEQISAFETQFGVSLPLKYREWLIFSDGGECYLPAGIQLYGVVHKPVIDVNDNASPSADYIVIGALATGDLIMCEKIGERISIYNREAGKIEDDEVFNDFFSFMSVLDELLGIGGWSDVKENL